MNKNAVTKFLGITFSKKCNNFLNESVVYKPNKLVCMDILYAKDNTYEQVLEMCDISKINYTTTSKIFIIPETKLVDVSSPNQKVKKSFGDAIVEAGSTEFVIKTENIPILVVYQNTKELVLLKEDTEKSTVSKSQQDNMSVMRYTPNNNYLLSLNLEKDKSSIKVKSVYVLDKSKKFKLVTSDPEFQSLKQGIINGFIDKMLLMDRINSIKESN